MAIIVYLNPMLPRSRDIVAHIGVIDYVTPIFQSVHDSAIFSHRIHSYVRMDALTYSH
jgi:hypothetical protein